jgi:hypothetical protein
MLNITAPQGIHRIVPPKTRESPRDQPFGERSDGSKYMERPSCIVLSTIVAWKLLSSSQPMQDENIWTYENSYVTVLLG